MNPPSLRYVLAIDDTKMVFLKVNLYVNNQKFPSLSTTQVSDIAHIYFRTYALESRLSNDYCLSDTLFVHFIV